MAVESKVDPTVSQAITDFATSLYLEHIEEASALYEQRLSFFDDPEITWQDIEDFEDRFEPHIDGLVVGKDLALDVREQQVIGFKSLVGRNGFNKNNRK